MLDLLIQFYAEYASSIFYVGKGIYLLSGIYGVYSFIRDWRYIKVELSIGTFTIRHKELNVQNVTNVVSALFYGGGQVPTDVRKEIIKMTMPKIKNVSRNSKS